MGTLEIAFIFVIYLLLFGAKGIPSLAQTLGKAVRQFREASSDIQREMMNTGREITQEMNRVKEHVDPHTSSPTNSSTPVPHETNEGTPSAEQQGEQATKS
jgi:sec-independent protein translocase protein TatA